MKRKVMLSWMNKRMVIHYLKGDGRKGFYLLAGINRPIKPNQVSKLVESIKKMGITRPVVVAKISFLTGDEQTVIIDGQHLYHGCLKLNVDIPYLYINVKDKQDLIEKIALLNSSSKDWCMKDYVVAWSNIVPDYVKLNSYFNKYDLEMSVLASVLSGNVGSTGGVINRKIKTGEFRIKNEEHNVQLLDYISDMLSLLPKANRFETKYTCNEYLRFLKNCPSTGKNKYNHQKFLDNLKKNKDVFMLAVQAENKLAELFNKFNKS